MSTLTLKVFFLFIPVLVIILLALNILLSPHNPDEAKLTPYESGFLPISEQTRSQFYLHFFKVALLFLVFDLEILLIFPAGVSLYQISDYGFAIALIFFIILTIGFILEIASGAVKITPGIAPKIKN